MKPQPPEGGPPRRQLLLRLAGLVGLVLAAAVVVAVCTWPLLIRPSTQLYAVPTHPDVQGSAWWAHAVADSVISGQSPFVRSDIAWPEGQDITLLLWNFGAQLLLLPLQLLDLSPVLIMNLSLWLILTVNGLVGAWAGHRVSGTASGTAAGLIAGATITGIFAEASYGRFEQALVAPLMIYFAGLMDVMDRPKLRPRAVALCGLGLAASAVIYWFWAYMLLLLTLPFVLAPLVTDRQWLKPLASSFALIGLMSVGLSLPLMLPVLEAMWEQPEFAEALSQDHGTAGIRTLNTVPLSGFLGQLLRGYYGGERGLRPPLLLLPALLWIVTRPGRIRVLAGCGLLALLLSLGTELQLRNDVATGVPLPAALLDILPGFGNFRWPYRWGLVAAATAPFVAGQIFGRVHPTGVALLGLWQFVELQTMIRSPRSPAPKGLLFEVEIPEVFTAIARMEGPRPILQVPLGKVPGGMRGWIPVHHQPVSSGVGWEISTAVQGDFPSRRARIPLLMALDDAQQGTPQVAPLGGWNLENSGGFHDVACYEVVGRPGCAEPVSLLLGAPFYADDTVSVWAVPGVGEVPDL